ncbi:MAG: GldG family protein [Chloroflexota bacterium]
MNKKKQSQKQERNYSFVALIFAGLAGVALLFLAITRGLVAMGTFTVANTDNLNRWMFVSAGLIILGLAAYAVMEPDQVRRFFTGRQARYGSNTLIMVIAFLGILIVGNVLAYQNPVKVADMTEDKTNTLSPELAGIVSNLPEKVTATGFFAQGSNTDAADKLLGNIKASSNGKFEYSFSNPDRDPQAAKKAGITGDGKILLEMGGRKEIVAYASEEEMLKGFERLTHPEANVVYFLTGHGERDIEQGSDAAMTKARSALETKNYTVKTLNLVAESKVPDDANVIIIAGPVKAVSTEEVKLLKGYLDKGGSLIVMEDPTALTDIGDADDPLSDMLSKDWGIVLNNDIVIDLDSPQPTTAVAAMYDVSHDVTRNMNNLITYYPDTRSLKMGNSVEGVTLNQLVQTNTRSWGETDFKSLTEGGDPVGFDQETETQGPLTLAIAGENATTQGQVVVFGTSKLAVDQLFDAYGNGDMFVNSVDWTAARSNLGTIAPKESTERTFKAPGQLQWIVILLGSVCLIPGLIVLAGASMWLSRRRRG